MTEQRTFAEVLFVLQTEQCHDLLPADLAFQQVEHPRHFRGDLGGTRHRPRNHRPELVARDFVIEPDVRQFAHGMRNARTQFAIG